MSNFWTVLLRRLVSAGHEVLCLVPDPAPGDDPAWEDALAGLGVRLVHYPLDRKGLNPLRDAKTLFALRTLFAEEKPDVLFGFTIKPVIYGSFAAALAGYPKKQHRHVMITGLGYMFEGNNPVKRLLMLVARGLYRAAFSCVNTVFFQNDDDHKLFEKLSILPASVTIRKSKGTGVDLTHFASHSLPEYAHAGENSADAATAPAAGASKVMRPSFLFVGRLIEAKGLRELAEAARILKAEYPDVRVRLLGPVEKGVGGVPFEEVQGWQSEGIIEYLGETRDVRPYLAEAGVVVLPSWREGTPCSLLEAMSTGRAIVAADAPGSREVVREGINGFLVPVRDPSGLANAMKRFILDPSLAARMGAAGRALVEEEFSAEQVARQLLQDIGVQ